MYQRILSDPLLFPQDMPHDAMTLITGLLQRDPAKRLGSNGAEEIKRHPFFSKHIDWNRCVADSCCYSHADMRMSEIGSDEFLASSLQAHGEEDSTSVQANCGAFVLIHL